MALTKISTGGVKDDAASQAKIADEAVDEARLQVSNAGSNGQFLQKQSGDTGGLTWATVDTNLSSDTTPQLGGDVDTNDHNIEFKDRNGTDDANVLNFGAGDDMRLYSDGTNGYLQADTELRIGTASNTTNAVFTNTKFDFRKDVDITNSAKLGIGGSYGTSGQFLTSGGSGAAPSWTTVNASPSITATADGDITAGDPIIVKPDGDVKKVGLAITVLNPPTVSTDKTLVTTNNLNGHELLWIPSLKKIVLGVDNSDVGDDFEVIVGEVTDAGVFTWGSIVQVETGTMQGSPTMAFDTNSNKVVAVWRDTGGNHIKSVVGTISGNSISFGTVVSVETGSESSKFGLCFDSTNNKVVTVWSEDSTGYAKSAVGTVSGTNISWGTAVDVNSENSDGFSCAYDPDTQRVLLVANMQSDSQINSYVGTVSGTSISWGSETQVVSVGHDVGIVYDTKNNKAVVGYRANSNDCLALVGTVTGSSTNSISWGSAATWFNLGNSGAARITYDDYTKLVVVQARRDASGSQYLYIASGTVSGTSISFTSRGQQTDVPVYGPGETGLCMAQKGQIISAGRIGSLDQDTYSFRGLAGTGATDLTTENYVGLAAAAANDNATATVDVSGATNTSQSSLTPGQKYFVQGDGTLGLTADTPKVFAGTAVSATKLIVNDAPIAVTPYGDLIEQVDLEGLQEVKFETLDWDTYIEYIVRFNNIRFVYSAGNGNYLGEHIDVRVKTTGSYLTSRYGFNEQLYKSTSGTTTVFNDSNTSRWRLGKQFKRILSSIAHFPRSAATGTLSSDGGFTQSMYGKTIGNVDDASNHNSEFTDCYGGLQSHADCQGVTTGLKFYASSSMYFASKAKASLYGIRG
tara:strand:+ start:821 stop:3397 length:2577 start_codon:yes stop_codon:yes gene_type:complete